MSTDLFRHPVFGDHTRWQDLLVDAAWPNADTLDRRLSPLIHGHTGKLLSFIEQSTLEADGRHYEERIHSAGRIATRAENWHDLFNALAWKRCPAIKSALNQRQVEDLALVGTRTRTRAQHALTHFDEAGIVVVLHDTTLLAAWDEHDWRAVFLAQRDAWRDGRVQLLVVGHALLEHALDPAMWLVAKALVFDASATVAGDITDIAVDARVGAAIAAGECLRDPQELRPLPVSGIPGWRDAVQDAAFYRDAPCFQPRREGRAYPSAMPWREPR